MILIRPLNKGQGHSFCYQSISTTSCRQMQSIVTFALWRTVDDDGRNTVAIARPLVRSGSATRIGYAWRFSDEMRSPGLNLRFTYFLTDVRTGSWKVCSAKQQNNSLGYSNTERTTDRPRPRQWRCWWFRPNDIFQSFLKQSIYRGCSIRMYA